MPQFQNVKIKIGLWIILPVLLLAFISLGLSKNNYEVRDGEYFLRTSGPLNTEFKGKIEFEEGEKIHNGIVINNLGLSFKGLDDRNSTMLQFLISRKAEQGTIPKGTYTISSNKGGFLNNFNGIFGYADVKALGEKPYIARKGSLVIKDKDLESLSGTLKVRLEDINGQSLYIEGYFIATKKN